MVTKNLDDFRKKWISGQKTAFLARNSAFFYATPMKPPFFGVRRTRLNGIISPPYPVVTLDNFGFLVGGRLAARRAVFLPPGPILARKSVFCYRTLDFVNGPFVTLDDIFDLAPSDRFLVAVRPLGGPFSGHRAGFWPENPFFSTGPRISSMARL